MEGSCSTGQSPQWAVVPVEEEEEEEEEDDEEEEEEEEEEEVCTSIQNCVLKFGKYKNWELSDIY
jgi:hypothetical protein